MKNRHFFKMITVNKYAIICACIFLCTLISAALEQPLPKGLMLNLDFDKAKDGVIPSKTLYPLHVPLGELSIEFINSRNILAIQPGQGLDIPHSLLLDPDGSEWVVSVRVFALTDGLILSQGNVEHGLAIYLKNGTVQATVRTGTSAIMLREQPERGIANYIRKWVTIDLQIKNDMALLSLNRKRVDMVFLQAPLEGRDMRIRLGEHRELPTVLKNIPGSLPTGFTGAIGSLKILRQ